MTGEENLADHKTDQVKGKVQEFHEILDQMRMMHQLGVIPIHCSDLVVDRVSYCVSLPGDF